MKLLVLAQLPPPVHGQSVMVRMLVTGLPAHGVEVHHVDLRLSRDAADIGRWRWGKLAAVVDACLYAVVARFRHGCDTLYYVPAPAKRGALYRDWLVMLLVRPFCRRLVLHWHAAGLGEWLRTRATAPERWLTRRLLGGADLSIVLGESLRDDAEALAARRLAVVPNGIPDPCPGGTARPRAAGQETFEVLFLGLGSEDKGLFTTAAAVLAANRAAGATRFRLTAAGAFPDRPTAARFAALVAAHPGELRHVGFVTGPAKADLFRASDCLCLPTRYAAEAQPLVVLEALAWDLPVIATRWRGLPEILPPAASLTLPPDDEAAAMAALLSLRRTLPPPGTARTAFLAGGTDQAHLKALAAALLEIG